MPNKKPQEETATEEPMEDDSEVNGEMADEASKESKKRPLSDEEEEGGGEGDEEVEDEEEEDEEEEEEEPPAKPVKRSTRKRAKVSYDEDEEDPDDPDEPDEEDDEGEEDNGSDAEDEEGDAGEENEEAASEKAAEPEPAKDKGIWWVKAKCGTMYKIDLNAEKPETFKTEKARVMWESATERNALRLKHQLETGEITIAELEGKYEKTPQQIEREKRRALLRWLAIESRIVTLDCNIRRSLQINNTDHEACLKHLDELDELPVEPRMLVKNPSVVDTLYKVRCYAGHEPIKEKASGLYSKFTGLFKVPAGKEFAAVFKEEHQKFQEFVKDVPPNKVYLVTDNFMPGVSPNFGLNFDDDAIPPAVPKSFLIHGPINSDVMADTDNVDIEEDNPAFKQIKAEVKAEPLEVTD